VIVANTAANVTDFLAANPSQDSEAADERMTRDAAVCYFVSMTLHPRQAGLIGAVLLTAGTTLGVKLGNDSTIGPLSHARPAVQVHFSPNGGCTDAIVRELDRAKRSVRVQAYSFTSAPIAKSLISAAKRGLDVQVILDKSNRTDKYSAGDFLAHANIPTFIDDDHAIAHNKLIIIDGTTVITGSFNFSKAAESSNAENLVIIRDAAIASRYVANWKGHRAHSLPYGGK